jgi:hypothetical protein
LEQTRNTGDSAFAGIGGSVPVSCRCRYQTQEIDFSEAESCRTSLAAVKGNRIPQAKFAYFPSKSKLGHHRRIMNWLLGERLGQNRFNCRHFGKCFWQSLWSRQNF